MPSFLITGSEGQLGRCFHAVAQEFPEHQLIFTKKKKIDLTLPNTFEKVYQIQPFDGIINCAAYTQVDQAEEESFLAQSINVDGVKNIIDFAEKKDLSVIHFSTDYVFDGKTNIPYKEDFPIHPINFYGYSKYKGEEIVKNSSCLHTIFRLSWMFSPFGENFVKTILKLTQAKKIIRVVDDQQGRPTYGIDLARVVLRNISKPDLFDFNCYHYAMQGTTTWFDFASKIIALKKSSCDIKPCSATEYPTLAKRPKQSILDTKLIENHLSLNIPSWQNALERCLKRIEINEFL
mgnify:FL=1|tara:strand:- start:1258 stop:2130 length:873 start_codon:yes stop_codon:yes gene_type:complete